MQPIRVGKNLHAPEILTLPTFPRVLGTELSWLPNLSELLRKKSCAWWIELERSRSDRVLTSLVHIDNFWLPVYRPGKRWRAGQTVTRSHLLTWNSRHFINDSAIFEIRSYSQKSLGVRAWKEWQFRVTLSCDDCVDTHAITSISSGWARQVGSETVPAIDLFTWKNSTLSSPHRQDLKEADHERQKELILPASVDGLLRHRIDLFDLHRVSARPRFQEA